MADLARSPDHLKKLAASTMREVERLLTILPTADAAGKAWADFGEIIVCDDEAGWRAKPIGSPPSTCR